VLGGGKENQHSKPPEIFIFCGLPFESPDAGSKPDSVSLLRRRLNHNADDVSLRKSFLRCLSRKTFNRCFYMR